MRLRISFPSLKNELCLSCGGGHLCTIGVVLGSEASSQTPPADSVKMSLPWHRDVPKVELLLVDAWYHLTRSQYVHHTYATRAEARHIKPDSTSERREALVSPGSSSPTTCPSDCWPAIASPVVPLEPQDVLQLSAGAELLRQLQLLDASFCHQRLISMDYSSRTSRNQQIGALPLLSASVTSCAAMYSSSSMAASFSPRCSSLALMFWYAQGGSSTRKENVSTRGLCNYHLQPENRIVARSQCSQCSLCRTL